MEPLAPAKTLDALPITTLKGVGSALAKTLEKLHIYTVQDMLFHLPMRYLDRTHVTAICDAKPNMSVVLEGKVANNQLVMGKRRSLAVTLEDATGTITLRFYHFNAAQKNALAPGTPVRCYGDTRLGRNGIEIYHPEYTTTQPGQHSGLEETLTPVYPLTDGVSQIRLRKIAQAAVTLAKTHPICELLPKEFNAQFKVQSLSAALGYLHCPPKDAPVHLLMEGTHPYQQRLAFEELLAHHLTLQKSRAAVRQEPAPVLPSPPVVEEFLAQLAFTPTTAQHRVIQEIQQDLRAPHPMLRLVQGDVGSGKTLVAAACALTALGNGYQVALAAPTEILAEQHRANFEAWFAPFGFEVAWLVGKLTAKQRQQTLQKLEAGQSHIAIGTHALFQEDVAFAKLGVVIIDEQHRFGVHQRLSLRSKSTGTRPHQLVMTATPIPRTLAMTAYSDLDLSSIDELPPGRTPVNTALISQDRKPQVIERIQVACAEGRQAYWVCTLVENSETLSAAAAEDTLAQLTQALPNLSIAMVHGRLKAKEKEAVMAAFKAGSIQLLVATTVIEVGVDVPNASLMIIENPERLGLAQLHQLRGRVGRGQAVSFCVLLYGTPLTLVARKRLQVLRDTTDGFAIAEHDLSIRGPGELLGTRQTGEMTFKMADIQRDSHLIPSVHTTADQLQRHNPLRGAKIIMRWFANHQQYLQG